ncbi:MAG: hypothetical protein K9M45_02035 [Kiritimatiellales bacterium]|nr:hypothetical protein [Kiritimatiellales bacterium]
MSDITDVIGKIPFRMAFAGGWIDQPFVNKLNPNPPGSMVVVAIEPNTRFMNRCGMSTSTRVIAEDMWGALPSDRDPADLVKELYKKENADKDAPSGAQDMVGLIYPGVSRIDFDMAVEGGYFPSHVESNTDEDVARWLEKVVYMVAVCPRPDGYFPLDKQNLSPEIVGRLSQSGKDCYDAILAKDAKALGASMNETMFCWETMLPDVCHHHTISMDLMGLLKHYQDTYEGVMFSGCAGGYFYVVSENKPVPGGIQVTVRTHN